MSGQLQLLFGATDKTSLLLQGSLRWQKSMNQRWSCIFDIYDPAQSYRPVVGQPFTINEDSAVMFTGLVDTIIEAAFEGTTLVKFTLQCSSWATICDHRVVVADYTGAPDVYAIINDILTNFMAGDGLTLGFLSDTLPMNQPLVFDGIPVATIFDQIRDSIGQQWWVDENKKIQFSAIGSGPSAPFSVTGANGDWITGTLQVKRTTSDFRNVQWVKTNTGLTTVSHTDTFTVASSLDWWLVTSFAINTAPVVVVGGVTQTIFQLGVDDYGQNGWYWRAGEQGVQQGQQIAPSIGTVVTVTYDALSSGCVSAQDAASIAARAAIEGTSGKWESVLNVPGITDSGVAGQIASGVLARGDFIPDEITLKTYRNNYAIGQQVHVVVAMHALNATYTVQSISAQHQAAMVDPVFGKSMLYTVVLSNAQSLGNFTKWFERLIKSVQLSVVPTSAAPAPTPTPLTGKPKATFVFGQGTDGQPADVILNSITNEYIVPPQTGGVVYEWQAIAETAPTGQSLIVDILRNGVSIFASTKVVIPAGSTSLQTGTLFLGGSPVVTVTLVPGDILKAKCTQIGSGAAGQSVTVNLYWQ